MSHKDLFKISSNEFKAVAMVEAKTLKILLQWICLRIQETCLCIIGKFWLARPSEPPITQISNKSAIQRLPFLVPIKCYIKTATSHWISWGTILRTWLDKSSIDKALKLQVLISILRAKLGMRCWQASRTCPQQEATWKAVPLTQTCTIDEAHQKSSILE